MSAVNGGGPVAQQDYTLQGVMRFLQTEWQKNERSRIQWEIERAEMKARIARLEGEKRGSEQLLETYVKRIAMLERALETQRSESRSTSEAPMSPADSDEPIESGDNAQSNIEIKLEAAVPVDFEPEIFDPDNQALIEASDKKRTRARENLEKCLQEVAYLLVFADSIPLPLPSQTDPGLMSIAQATKQHANLQHQQQPQQPPQYHLQQQRSIIPTSNPAINPTLTPTTNSMGSPMTNGCTQSVPTNDSGPTEDPAPMNGVYPKPTLPPSAEPRFPEHSQLTRMHNVTSELGHIVISEGEVNDDEADVINAISTDPSSQIILANEGFEDAPVSVSMETTEKSATGMDKEPNTDLTERDAPELDETGPPPPHYES
ncbi:Striatin family-domain-containing protein [Lipomyces oligophaga]|uniref:Striatin family-domain-containing protein n=1 Tax=Lipomyces oligophaga TaxID=45792 RepID=UPI0034CF456A